ncbi:hypothetical protein C7M84_003472 [Penaeus vannamei]|uniref:FZ domain-containing protein n=1 Tax=Penaeus vannamei TaxID=6689 RepID=A0A423TN27_PENVA|nr:hypothetical protein C7M84_003472 [Penaeus vannamei]
MLYPSLSPQEAYKYWVCSQLFPYYDNGRHIKPCRRFCHEVEQKCPYLLPKDKPVAGEPTFLCEDPAIGELENQESSYGKDSCCYKLSTHLQPMCSFNENLAEHQPPVLCSSCPTTSGTQERPSDNQCLSANGADPSQSNSSTAAPSSSGSCSRPCEANMPAQLLPLNSCSLLCASVPRCPFLYTFTPLRVHKLFPHFPLPTHTPYRPKSFIICLFQKFIQKCESHLPVPSSRSPRLGPAQSSQSAPPSPRPPLPLEAASSQRSSSTSYIEAFFTLHPHAASPSFPPHESTHKEAAWLYLLGIHLTVDRAQSGPREPLRSSRFSLLLFGAAAASRHPRDALLGSVSLHQVISSADAAVSRCDVCNPSRLYTDIFRDDGTACNTPVAGDGVSVSADAC